MKDSQEIELRQDTAVMLRNRLESSRLSLKESTVQCEKNLSSLEALRKKLEGALVRSKELESGRGLLLAGEGSIRVYEFWLEFPGYSGPIRGASAQLVQHGNLNHVSDVTSKQKSGLGGAVVGGLLLGPLGAAAGALATRKNEVKTDVRTVDTRQIEFQIVGPGYAWSTVVQFGLADKLRKLRDMIVSRGSVTETVQSLLQSEQAAIAELRIQAANSSHALQLTEQAKGQHKNACEEAWKGYQAARLPLWADLKFRWQCTSLVNQVIAILLGPVLLVVLGGLFVYARAGGNFTLTIQVSLLTLLALGSWAGAFAYFLKRFRF
jgi:hypothetical protein